MSEIDVEKFRTEHECDEHWELRKKFLMTYKDKYPEDELICLAQVFINVEMLGCTYPKETMKIIGELSEQVVSDYREKKKGRLQRTFIGAKQAAENKASRGRRSA